MFELSKTACWAELTIWCLALYAGCWIMLALLLGHNNKESQFVPHLRVAVIPYAHTTIGTTFDKAGETCGPPASSEAKPASITKLAIRGSSPLSLYSFITDLNLLVSIVNLWVTDVRYIPRLTVDVNVHQCHVSCRWLRGQVNAVQHKFSVCYLQKAHHFEMLKRQVQIWRVANIHRSRRYRPSRTRV